MNFYENRLKTFIDNPWPLNNQEHKFPVELFAAAGFHFSPTNNHPDATSCYLCRKDLDGWEPDDDPWLAHIKHGRMSKKIMIKYLSSLLISLKKPDHIKKSISSLLTHLKLGPDEVQCPLVTLFLEQSRLFTFSAGWPHPLHSNFKATPFSLAASGFFFFPALSLADQVICYQCGLALNGWEAEDDPWIEHCNRRSDCLHVNGSPTEPYSFISFFSACPIQNPLPSALSTTLEKSEASSPSLEKIEAVSTDSNKSAKYSPIPMSPLSTKIHLGDTASNNRSSISKRSSLSKDRPNRSIPRSKIRLMPLDSDIIPSTPVSPLRIKEIITTTRKSSQYYVNPRQSGQIKQPYCSSKDIEKISSMTVSSYLDWIVDEIMNAFDRVTKSSV